MYFKIEPSGCYERKGLVQIRFDCFLDEGDSRYDEYTSRPFCCHFRLFDSDVTDDELVSAGKEILIMAYENFQTGDLSKNRNAKITYISGTVAKQRSIERVSAVRATDFSVKIEEQRKERVE